MNHIAFVQKLSSVLICVQTSSLDFKVLDQERTTVTLVDTAKCTWPGMEQLQGDYPALSKMVKAPW